MIQDSFTILVVLVAVVLVSLRLVERFRWAERLSAILWILFLAALLSNLGLIPTDAPIYGPLADYSVPFAVSLVLLSVSLADVKRAGRAMTVAFGVASLGTALGVTVAGVALEPFLRQILGDASWKLAGPYTGTYIGGSLNFFALWSGLEINDPDLFAAANAVDNLTIFPLFVLWMVVPGLLLGRYAVANLWRVEESDGSEAAASEKEKAPRFLPAQVTTLAFLALAIMAASDWIKTTLIDPFAPQVPSILVVTTLALLLGQIPFVRRLEGAWELGYLAFYLFFAAVGAMIDIGKAIVLSPILFVYVSIIIVVHMATVYGLGRLLKMDVAVLTIASVAAKTGPAFVPAVTESKGWHHLTLPGMLMGLVGYAIGNYAGFAVAYLVKLLLGA